MELVFKQKNNENIVEIHFFFLHLLFDSENLYSILIFKIKNDNVLIFNIVHLPNFEIGASLYCHPLISTTPNSFKI